MKPEVESKSVQKAEALTKEIDREGMRYLSYLLYPLCIAGAVYSLIYQPHKRYTIFELFLRSKSDSNNFFVLILKKAGIRGH